jgi:uncharacterized SAM-binding protein YcdF (DUF218 family)|tara:strand:+ start:172 stop:807 length:636 start_codon:yes stop_codon:yes gene_type:complete
MKDVIIVLAGGVNPDGTLPKSPKARVEKGVELYKDRQARKLVMSGAYGFWLDWLKKVPVKHESVAMKEYAISLGVPSDAILIEDQSKDTLGNAYFTKINVLEKYSWKDVVVVTSEFHIPRTKIVFDVVLGPDYKINYVPSENILTDEEQAKWQESEKKTIVISNQIVDVGKIKAGDTKAIEDILFTVHPGYADNPTISFEKLEEMLGRNAR